MNEITNFRGDVVGGAATDDAMREADAFVALVGERVRAARGTFAVSSPETGTTTVTAVLPCAL